MKRLVSMAGMTAGMLLVLHTTADAQVTPADASCRAAIQKNAGKLAGTAMKTIDGCIKNALGGKITATSDCNDLTVADWNGKVAAAATKANDGIQGKCLAIPANIVGVNCPSPADAQDGGDNAVSSVAELASCQEKLNTDTVENLRRYILKPDVPSILAQPNVKAISKCVNSIAKGATKLWSTVSKTRGKCQATQDKLPDEYSYYDCATFDDGKIAGAVTKLEDSIQKACGDTALTQGELALVGSCASSVAEIKSCVANAVKKNAGGSTAVAYEFGQVCPSTVRVVVNAGGKNGMLNSSTRLDLGWTGLGHDADVPDGFTGRVNVSCSSDDCSNCSLTVSCAEGNCRCSNAAQTVCTTPFAAGGPCGAGTCTPYFGPPLPLSAGGTPICVTRTIGTELVGTANLGTGESNTLMKTLAKVYLGMGQDHPCPICSGSGFCTGGQRNGLPCQTDAVSTTFGSTSYDCPPSAAANISGSGLKLNLNMTDGTASLSAGDACDAPLAALSCTCGGCTLDNTVACGTDADCSGAGLGTCNNAGSGVLRQPNQCSDLTCTNAGGEGTCQAGPTDSFCDGITTTKGEGFLTCNTNADCAAFVPSLGNCTLSRRRSCNLNPITATGVAGTDGAELVSTFCSGPTNSGGVNAAFGLPGPGRERLDMDFTALCADGTTEYELGGANCP